MQRLADYFEGGVLQSAAGSGALAFSEASSVADVEFLRQHMRLREGKPTPFLQLLSSPRELRQCYLDAMAIIQNFGQSNTSYLLCESLQIEPSRFDGGPHQARGSGLHRTWGVDF